MRVDATGGAGRAGRSRRADGRRAERRHLRLVVLCSCGDQGRVPFGERWPCPRCGSVWDTAGVPHAEYAAFVRAVRRTKILGLAGLVVAAIVFLPLAMFVSSTFAITGLTVLAVFYFWFGPYYRRRIRRLRAGLPQWELDRSTPGLPNRAGSG
jgi:hypothetical protein